MKISEMVNKYNFHDSIVEDIRFLHDERKLMIKVELCNWRQTSYKDGDTEIIEGNLVFSDVKKYEIEPGSVFFDSDEILETEVSQISEDNEMIKMVLLGSDNVKVINIQASNVDWIASENA